LASRLNYDNSGTAPASTIISADGSTLQWGTNPPTDVGTVFSTLQFTGDFLPLGDTTTPTQLGTITFTNGTSALTSIIFGATLTFYLDGIELGSDEVLITTTSNQSSGTDLTPAAAQLDADYINICGNSSNICGTGIQAFENTEGEGGVAFSTPLTAGLNGTYDTDVALSLTSASYVSGDGVVSGRPSVVPEPSTWAMMLLGFAGLAFGGYRASRKGAAPA
jgi:PEP-CTERM motif